MHFFFPALVLACLLTATGSAQLIDKQQLLDAQTFWDNRDWPWYKANIPFLDTPDADINTTYYYRWELVTKHRVYGSPASGYAFTEFMDRPFWSGAYGAISCPAGHQLYEIRWLHDKRYAQDYARYWFRTSGAEPRRYSNWLADSVWATYLVQGDRDFAIDLLPDLTRQFEGWEEQHFVPEIGLFWQTGHDDGMELNITSRQSEDIVRGAPAYRPSFNAYMYGEAMAISRIARLAGDDTLAGAYQGKAKDIRQRVQEKLWDPERHFFFPMFKNDEEKDGYVVKAGTLTYETGKFAGSEHGRELIGYVPWQFSLPDPGRGFENAWKFLMAREYFRADFGPTVTERRDPLFLVTDQCCWWSGQSWPYATTQTLVAMANLLNHYDQKVVNKEDYFQILKAYTRTHRKDDRPYVAEAANPDTGSWKGYDNYFHSEHYFHSAYADLIITGLAGLRPRNDEVVEVNPMIPDEWTYFALADVQYRGHMVSIVWDRSGGRYGLGAGLRLIVDGDVLAVSEKIEKLTARLSDRERPVDETQRLYNFAVNNDGAFYPHMTASFSSQHTAPTTAQDGQFWYHVSPPNRWTTEGGKGDSDWLAVDFGTTRLIHRVTFYPLDDDDGISVPAAVKLEYRDGGSWKPVPSAVNDPATPVGRRANSIRFPVIPARMLRLWLVHQPNAASGLSELEAWGELGEAGLAAPERPRSLASAVAGLEFPKVRASYTSRFDQLAEVNDGKISYRPSPHNRWTAYESPRDTDWLEIDFGRSQVVGRVDLHIYDDGGGVQAPNSYRVEYAAGGRWTPVQNVEKSPEIPRGGTVNKVTFDPVRTRRIRVVFEHAQPARSGLTEIDVWERR